jgi:hypothetical protein
MTKRKWSLSIIMALLLAMILGSSALALEKVSYDDTSADGWDVNTEGGGNSYIMNGDFANWVDGQPEHWAIAETSASGWENGAHLANMDYSESAEGANNAMGLFVRNTGGSGSFFGYATQELSLLPGSDYYWVTVHITAWGNKDGSGYNRSAALYNSLAWYAISTEANPMDVDASEWRELFPDSTVCENENEICNHLGRHETVFIEDGSYFHLKAGHKFNFFNAWTVFGMDDISIVDAGGTVIDDGFIDDGDVMWDSTAAR